ncbi:MAG: Rieske (2Fe-2S) protein [Gammaproteobacteria bacterium]
MPMVDVAASSDVRAGALHACSAAGLSLLLTRVDGAACAVENRCSHLGLSLARGGLDGTVLKCPWHGSSFDVRTGKNLDWVNSVVGVPVPKWTRTLIALGKSPAPIRVFEVSETGGRISVNLP